MSYIICTNATIRVVYRIYCLIYVWNYWTLFVLATKKQTKITLIRAIRQWNGTLVIIAMVKMHAICMFVGYVHYACDEFKWQKNWVTCCRRSIIWPICTDHLQFRNKIESEKINKWRTSSKRMTNNSLNICNMYARCGFAECRRLSLAAREYLTYSIFICALY